MRCPIILALLLDSALLAVATKCQTGFKHKTDLTNLFCSTAATDAAACSSTCCEKDTTKCGGLTVTCDPDKYYPLSETWQKKAATEKTKKTACCAEKATCSQMSADACPAGYKPKVNTGNPAKQAWNNKRCPGDVKTCGAVCCEKNSKTCGGNDAVLTGASNCAGALVFKIAGTTLADDAWKKHVITGTGKANEEEACCALKAKCSSALYACPAGYKKKVANKDKYCKDGTPESCKNNVVADTCCEKNTATCGGVTPSCAGNTYDPHAVLKSVSWGNKATTATTKDRDCCTTMATCKDAVCSAGYKKKKNVDKLICPSNRESCAAVTGPCCEKDTNTCGGMTGIACPYGFFDESTTWTTKTSKAVKDAWKSKNTTSATKNTNCCTPQAVCEYEAPGTTTPSPVVTTTPAAPVRRYSEHMMAVKKASNPPHSSNLVWLAVGGFIGMGVLMAVQGLRSRMSTQFASLE